MIDLETQDERQIFEYKLHAKLPLRTDFTDEEKRYLRPIAETLAMLDGNAFFGGITVNNTEWYEQYLPEAWALWKNNGGVDGWSGATGWATELTKIKQNPGLQTLRDQMDLLLTLTKDNNEH